MNIHSFYAFKACALWYQIKLRVQNMQNKRFWHTIHLLKSFQRVCESLWCTTNFKAYKSSKAPLTSAYWEHFGCGCIIFFFWKEFWYLSPGGCIPQNHCNLIKLGTKWISQYLIVQPITWADKDLCPVQSVIWSFMRINLRTWKCVY